MGADIVVGGDVCPVRRHESINFQDCHPADIFGFLYEEFIQTDYSIINLETPLTDLHTPILKTGPSFKVDRAFAPLLAKTNIRAVNLANNHIMDQGCEGLEDTLGCLDQNGILHVGAGKNLEQAKELLDVNINGLRVGFLGMADREFSIASRHTPGANPFDLIEFVRSVRKKRADLDFLVVLLHEGVQHFRFPTPELQKRCRFLIEEGADAVICQHSHCTGCYEIYQDRPIVYGQGDLISDSVSNLKDNTGFLVKLYLDQTVQMSLIPYKQTSGGVVSRMTAVESEIFFSDLEQRNLVLNDAHALEGMWRDYCRLMQDSYYAQINGYARELRFLNRKLHLIQKVSSMRAAVLLNLVRCSAHREALEMIFSDILSQKET